MEGRFSVTQFTTDDELAHAAGEAWFRELSELADEGPALSVALPGGRVTRKFFVAFASRSISNPPRSLSRLHFFWGDERCVPPEDVESNYRIAEESLLGPLAISPSNIHRIRGEISPQTAAEEASEQVRSVLDLDEGGNPVFDWVFLGMGEDGHVASLFPGEPEGIRPVPSIYRPVVAVKPPPHRITLGYSVLQSAREVWVLAAGKGKADALKESTSDSVTKPLGRVISSRKFTRIFAAVAG